MIYTRLYCGRQILKISSHLNAKKSHNARLTGQISAVTFCAKTRTKAAIKNLLGEPGVS